MRVISEANLTPLAPDADLTGKTWAVRIIEGDRQGASAYYPARVLQESAPLFAKGTRVYMDHPTLSEQEERPARSANDLIGYLAESAKFDGKDLVGSVTFLPSKVERIRELAEAGLIGLSIRALGEFAEDGETLARFKRVLSVDVVTEAGAGGEFRSITESSASESGAGSQKEEEQMDEIKEAIAALTASVTALVEANAAERDARAAAEAKAVEEAAAAAAKAAADAKPSLSEVVEAAAELTAAGRKAVLDAFEAGQDYKPVLEAEKAREAEIRESASGFKGHEIDLNENKAEANLGSVLFG